MDKIVNYSESDDDSISKKKEEKYKSNATTTRSNASNIYLAGGVDYVNKKLQPIKLSIP